MLPMLPEELCNDLCSLRPHEDKLCMSVVFTMTQEAEVVKHKICRTVIRSDARLDYDEAQAMIGRSSEQWAVGSGQARESRLRIVRDELRV